jgi:hypothetical protein
MLNFLLDIVVMVLFWISNPQNTCIRDPLFDVVIDSNFRSKIYVLGQGNFKYAMENLVICLGICPDASVAVDMPALVIMEELLDIYANLCRSNYFAMWKDGFKNVVISKSRFIPAPLPNGWYHLTKRQRTGLQYVVLTRNAVGRRMMECAPPAGDECPICFESASVSGPWVLLRGCRHQFHAKCVMKLVCPSEAVWPKCPLCRAEI